MAEMGEMVLYLQKKLHTFLNFSNRASRKFYPPHMADNMYSRVYISKGWCCSRISSVQVLAKCSATLILGGQPSFSPHEALQAL